MLDAATTANNAAVHRVTTAVRALQVEEGDIQTDDVHVTLGYNSNDQTIVDYYEVSKGIQVLLRDCLQIRTAVDGGVACRRKPDLRCGIQHFGTT